jgi:hypothetical protein
MEMIVRCLEWRSSILALRATSRTICTKSSQGRFAAFFRKKTLELTEDALRKALPVCATFGRRIQELSISCLILGPFRLVGRPNLEESETVMNLLAECFTNLNRGPGDHSLQSITLDLQDQPSKPSEEHFKPFFPAMALLHALKISGLGVPVLVLNKCRFPMNAFRRDLVSTEQSSILESVRDLSLYVSHSVNDTYAIEPIDHTSSAECGMTISKIFEGASNLKSLNLNWFNIRDPDLQKQWPDCYATEQLTFGTCLSSLASAPLQKLSLGGIHTTAAILCDFFASTSARDIKLEGLHLHQGSWTNIFNILTRSAEPLAEIYLLDLFDDNHQGFGMIFFETDGTPIVPMSGGSIGPSALRRCGPNVRRPIKWEFGVGAPEPCSWQYGDWQRHQKFLFGPVDKRKIGRRR